jgi:hypothetical protein
VVAKLSPVPRASARAGTVTKDKLITNATKPDIKIFRIIVLPPTNQKISALEKAFWQNKSVGEQEKLFAIRCPLFAISPEKASE